MVENKIFQALADPSRRAIFESIMRGETAVKDLTARRLSLVQSGFKPDQKQNFGGARYGWKMMGGKLVDLLGRIS